MIILGIETSCDETAASIVSAEKDKIAVVSNIVSSQVRLHAKWGGVVPNLAAREHLKNILPVINKCLKEAKIDKENISLIAVTCGPGLIPALLIGVNAAKTLGYLWQKPAIGIHHIEGHIYANFISAESKKNNDLKFPILSLVVSGGHTQLVLMKKHLHYQIVGETLDDAAGEAFDKVARILGLGYPGGPIISKLASKIPGNYKLLDATLPRPKIKSNDLDFSFSGLKTAVLYMVKKNEKLLSNKRFVAEISHEFQSSVIDVLVSKTIAAAKIYNPKTICISGGVSANSELRKQLGEAVAKNFPRVKFRVPEAKYSIDNASMIAAAAYYRMKYQRKKRDAHSWKKIQADANMRLDQQ